jgi:four helix bundle protein
MTFALEENMADYRNSTAWQAAHELVLVVYESTASMPAAERFGLQAQIRRAAVSTASNLAEGIGRRTSYSELRRFCDMAAGSAAEVEYQALLIRDLKLVSEAEYAAIEERLTVCVRRIAGFRRWLESQEG